MIRRGVLAVGIALWLIGLYTAAAAHAMPYHPATTGAVIGRPSSPEWRAMPVTVRPAKFHTHTVEIFIGHWHTANVWDPCQVATDPTVAVLGAEIGETNHITLRLCGQTHKVAIR